VALLDELDALGVSVWVDGGWGVDALLGEQHRPHADLDLVMDAAAVERVVRSLVDRGFVIVRDWLPTAVALRHADGREVDLHPVAPTEDGGGDQVQVDGSLWHYEPPVLGRIDRRRVRCCSLETQIASHLGYEPTDTDRDDMRVLADRFGVELPPPYRS